MTLTNILKDRVQIQLRTSTQGPGGEAVVWSPVETRYCRKIPLDVRTISQYQQLNTVVTDKFLFRGSVTIELGKYRLLHGGKVYEPVESAQHLADMTVVIVKEV